ncbi:uncharacterized protein LOC124266024 [Haliotis rubra]|uniref:uncharacterized protein LOC124266024 n=1 Tax=Haliotis rubra TaxID=36100 RepID=UPI001EE569C7|nr:uncharacterized protein LOC124266024 [Haliotis rubra]
MSEIAEEEDSHSDSDSNTYESLLPTSSSRSVLLQPSDITSTAQAYRLARGATIPQADRQHSRSRHSRGHHRRRSSNNIFELRQFYKNVKKCFLFMIVCNVLVVILLFVTHPKFGFLVWNTDEDFPKDGHPNTLQLCVKCETLYAKVGPTLISHIRSHENPGFCCFRHVYQLLKLVDNYTKEFIKQEENKLRVKYPRNIPSSCESREPVIAHTYYNGSSSSITLTWEPEGIDILMLGIRLVSSRSLAVNTPGYYYVYSHVHITSNTTYRHDILNNGTALVTNTGTQTAYSILQGIFHLPNGSSLSVSVTPNVTSGTRRFGLYKLKP